ncbi:MAG: hypothetical protein ACLTK6_15680 [Clostridium perfringens]|jgi:hypothetical protein
MDLLQRLKEKLNITWAEEETENRLQIILEDAKLTLNYKLGAEIDYSSGMERSLLLNYCMYAWNNCENEFDDNYFNNIMQLRQKYEVQNEDNQL